MREQLKKAMPGALRRRLGRAVSESVMLYRDSVSVRDTLRSLAPVALKSGLTLRSYLRKPTVCAVFAGRNDDYVPDNEARIRAVIEWNTKVLCDEVVFVEWNPLPDRPLLSPDLTRDYPNLRCYVVPPEIHTRVCRNSRIPVMEYFAKNVGMRRAQSDYICATNADILWDENVRRIYKFLDPRVVFRTRRIELRWDGQPPTQKYLRDPANIIEYKFGWRQMLTYGCGDFTLAHRDLWHRARGYDESLMDSRLNCDGRGLLQLFEIGGKPAHMGFHYHLYHQTSSASSGNVSHGGSFEYWKNLPYANPETWGLGDCAEEPLAERVWKLV
jgi:hypothetical protein